jgi:hypothetical protein
MGVTFPVLTALVAIWLMLLLIYIELRSRP